MQSSEYCQIARRIRDQERSLSSDWFSQSKSCFLLHHLITDPFDLVISYLRVETYLTPSAIVSSLAKRTLLVWFRTSAKLSSICIRKTSFIEISNQKIYWYFFRTNSARSIFNLICYLIEGYEEKRGQNFDKISRLRLGYASERTHIYGLRNADLRSAWDTFLNSFKRFDKSLASCWH